MNDDDWPGHVNKYERGKMCQSLFSWNEYWTNHECWVWMIWRRLKICWKWVSATSGVHVLFWRRLAFRSFGLPTDVWRRLTVLNGNGCCLVNKVSVEISFACGRILELVKLWRYFRSTKVSVSVWGNKCSQRSQRSEVVWDVAIQRCSALGFCITFATCLGTLEMSISV